jgi:hypothetical protein
MVFRCFIQIESKINNKTKIFPIFPSAIVQINIIQINCFVLLLKLTWKIFSTKNKKFKLDQLLFLKIR